MELARFGCFHLSLAHFGAGDGAGSIGDQKTVTDYSAAAAALEVPESLVRRSAEARAKADNVSVDELVAAWAGGGSAPAPSAPPPVVEEAPSPVSEVSSEPAPAATVPTAPSVPTAPTLSPAPEPVRSG